MTAIEAIQKAQADVAAEVAKIVPIIQTIPALKQQIADLQAALTAAGTVDPAVQAAADSIEGSVKTLDDAANSLTAPVAPPAPADTGSGDTTTTETPTP